MSNCCAGRKGRCWQEHHGRRRSSSTRQAQLQAGATAEVSVGNQGLVEGKGSITGPLIADKLAFRVSGYYTQTDGNYRNLSSIEKQNAGRVKAFVRNCCSRRPTTCRSA
jgi:outer membrane receptor for ferrienterochelin and colicin